MVPKLFLIQTTAYSNKTISIINQIESLCLSKPLLHLKMFYLINERLCKLFCLSYTVFELLSHVELYSRRHWFLRIQIKSKYQ